jgi:S1-C subfamily serine protease
MKSELVCLVRKLSRRWISAFGIALALANGFLPMIARGGVDSPGTDELKALCEKAKAAYVFISGGSGVVIRPDGLMLTNSHVIERNRHFDVRTGIGKHYKANVLGHDPFGDLALLKLELKEGEQVPFLELGDSEALHVGDATLAVGNPFAVGFVDQAPTFTLGVVSGLRQLQGQYTECIVTDAEINPGNSGGPLVNMAGQVVGINGQISTRWGLRSNTGLGFAISARQIALWLPKLMEGKGGTVMHGFLAGVEFENSENSIFEAPRIKEVRPGTPSAQAGLAAGDVVVALDGTPTVNMVRMASVLGIYPADFDVTLDVRRGEQQLPLKVRLISNRRSRIGFRVGRPAAGDQELKVSEVVPDSPAAKAGMKPGDVLLEFQGLKLDQRPEIQFRALAAILRRGALVYETVRVKIRRKNEAGEAMELEFAIEITEGPDTTPDEPKPIYENEREAPPADDQQSE